MRFRCKSNPSTHTPDSNLAEKRKSGFQNFANLRPWILNLRMRSESQCNMCACPSASAGTNGDQFNPVEICSDWGTWGRRAMRNRQNLIVLPGDGIGPEVIRQTVRVVEWFANRRGFDCDIRQEDFGAEAYHRTGIFLKEEVLADMMTADAVLFGAMGGALEANPIPHDIRRRFGLLRVRKEMELFANLRPVKFSPALAAASPLREEIARGVDLIILRELIGGIYFGEPRGIETFADGRRRGFDTQVYTSSEIRRIGKVAFELAARRRRHVTSVDQSNVMKGGA